eukprot:IDg18018t1
MRTPPPHCCWARPPPASGQRASSDISRVFSAAREKYTYAQSAIHWKHSAYIPALSRAFEAHRCPLFISSPCSPASHYSVAMSNESLLYFSAAYLPRYPVIFGKIGEQPLAELPEIPRVGKVLAIPLKDARQNNRIAVSVNDDVQQEGASGGVERLVQALRAVVAHRRARTRAAVERKVDARVELRQRALQTGVVGLERQLR